MLIIKLIEDHNRPYLTYEYRGYYVTLGYVIGNPIKSVVIIEKGNLNTKLCVYNYDIGIPEYSICTPEYIAFAAIEYIENQYFLLENLRIT